MAILIENLQSRVQVMDQWIELIEHAAEMSLKSEKFQIPSEISILLVDDAQIQAMNLEHRNIDKSTDVLSFPMVHMTEGKIITDVGDFDLDENLLLLGDIVISLETAVRQAEEYGHSFERELAFLVTHGVFHLLGFDHENEEQEKTMMERQEGVLKAMRLGKGC